MASFYGTIEDVDRFLMPRIRNKVQTLTRPYKDLENGICQHCGKENGALEAAHVHGRGRKAIVRNVLENYRSGNGYHIVDLDLFEEDVVAAHEPIGETFLFLCRDCHREYDGKREAAPLRFDTQADAAPLDGATTPGFDLSSEFSPFGTRLFHDETTTFQEHIRRTLKELYETGVLDDGEIERLMDGGYSKRAFALCYPMLVHEKDNVAISGQKRYWSKPLFRDLCCCSEWQKSRFHIHEPKFAVWICAIEEAHYRGAES